VVLVQQLGELGVLDAGRVAGVNWVPLVSLPETLPSGPIATEATCPAAMSLLSCE